MVAPHPIGDFPLVIPLLRNNFTSKQIFEFIYESFLLLMQNKKISGKMPFIPTVQIKLSSSVYWPNQVEPQTWNIQIHVSGARWKQPEDSLSETGREPRVKSLTTLL